MDDEDEEEPEFDFEADPPAPPQQPTQEIKVCINNCPVCPYCRD